MKKRREINKWYVCLAQIFVLNLRLELITELKNEVGKAGALSVKWWWNSESFGCSQLCKQTKAILFVERGTLHIRLSSQIRSCLVPDSLKSKGHELRRVMRSTSTDVARERRQGILLKPTILKILLGAGFKVALLPSSFGCPVAMSLKKRFISIPFVNTLTKCWENVA